VPKIFHGITPVTGKLIMYDRFLCSTSDHKTDHHAQKSQVVMIGFTHKIRLSDHAIGTL
jgi:hypothetical protein